jgi:NAD(P)-dependent dehydrogenase (short-subunit alcohol dehydrogenase family)
MLYEILAIAGGASTIGLLIAFLWARAGKASAQKAAAEQERFAEELKAALEAAQKARTTQDQRYEDLVHYWQSTVKEMEVALDACSHDPAAVRARLRDLLSAPPAADPGGGAGGSLPP